jgi:hypothetical protein
MKEGKTFAIGFNKSATVSLSNLFQKLGLRSYHGHKWRYCDDMDLLHSYDCFADGPALDPRPLDKLFPGSKFILQVRDLQSWIYSRLAHIDRFDIDGTNNLSPEWDQTEFAVKTWIVKRNKFHLDVMSYFYERSYDFLIVNFIRDEAAATKVCNFLGYGGEYHKPRCNVNSASKPKASYVHLFEESIRMLGIEKWETKCDLYCPSLVSDKRYLELPFDTSNL